MTGLLQSSISIPAARFLSLTINGHDHSHTAERKQRKITGRLEALYVPGGLQEVVSQIQEDGEKRNNGEQNPGDDHGGDCNHSDDLEKHLKEKERCEPGVLQTATGLKGLLLLRGIPLVQRAWSLNSVQEEIFPVYLC